MRCVEISSQQKLQYSLTRCKLEWDADRNDVRSRTILFSILLDKGRQGPLRVTCYKNKQIPVREIAVMK